MNTKHSIGYFKMLSTTYLEFSVLISANLFCRMNKVPQIATLWYQGRKSWVIYVLAACVVPLSLSVIKQTNYYGSLSKICTFFKVHMMNRKFTNVYKKLRKSVGHTECASVCIVIYVSEKFKFQWLDESKQRLKYKDYLFVRINWKKKKPSSLELEL